MIREEVAEASTPIEIRALGKENIQKCKNTVDRLRENFKTGDVEAAKKNTIYLQYLSKIQEEVEQKLGERVL